MYAITNKKTKALDLVAHERMEGRTAKVFENNAIYAVNIGQAHPEFESVSELRGDWVETDY